MIDGLSRLLPSRDRRALEHTRRAAVLVALIDDGAPMRLLLTRRTELLKSHTGQVAFPGGGTDPTDADATATALREAHEEVGLPPAAVETVGWLDDFITVGARMAVTPVVGHVRDLPPLQANPGEVAHIFTIPIADLRVADRWRVEHWGESGRSWPLYFFDHEGETLWGLSAAIVLHLLSLTPAGAPFELPGFQDAMRRRLADLAGTDRLDRKP